MLVLSLTSVRQHDSGVGLEDWGDGSGNGTARGCAVGDPGDLSVRPDPPRAAVPGPRDHAISLDSPATGLIDRREPPWFSLAHPRLAVPSAVTGNVCPVPRAEMSLAASGGRTIEPVTEEDF